jgi:glycosyltransferase involved in cell wall biosynthesis
MPQISVVIIAFNEEKYIEQCIKSVVDIADEIVVVDSYSTDRTPEICKQLGVAFIQQEFLGYKEQKNFALAQAKYDYVLSLDADEALSHELRNSILKIKKQPAFECQGYKIGRLNNFCGRWIYYTTLSPERKVRFFNKKYGEWGGINPHDKVVMHSGAKVGILKGEILHWLADTYEAHISKINKFSTISAESYFKLGRRSSITKIIFRPCWRFFHSYILKMGFLDGIDGFTVSKIVAALCFYKYIKLYKIQKDAQIGTSKPRKKVLCALPSGEHVDRYFNKSLATSLNLKSHKPSSPKSISVIITTYNQPEWLEKVLWGYESQSFKNFEIIIADDGSGPETKRIVDSFIAKKTLDIKHVWHPDVGYQKCTILNKAIAQSKNDYILFSDGDCIPRADFIEVHIKGAEPGYFLSGGAIRLTQSISNEINEDDVKNQIVFDRGWLIKRGLKNNLKNTKLIKAKFFGSFMNFITTAKATWNGGNSSGWKIDIIAVNGFNEDLHYGGQDREFGERMKNLGLRSKQIRYSAICLHLDHPRPYKTTDSIKRNTNTRQFVQKAKIARTNNGLSQWLVDNKA